MFVNIGIIIFVSVILKKIAYSSNSSNISDNVNIVEITSTQHYTRIA